MEPRYANYDIKGWFQTACPKLIDVTDNADGLDPAPKAVTAAFMSCSLMSKRVSSTLSVPAIIDSSASALPEQIDRIRSLS